MTHDTDSCPDVAVPGPASTIRNLLEQMKNFVAVEGPAMAEQFVRRSKNSDDRTAATDEP